ncbi:MAG: type II secretion system F family protein [Betaproteobacteria bacterium]|nr:type II secretion system F family protein [Betaproteobacteria bacterium]
MPLFVYKGRNARGELVTGRLESPDNSAVATQLVNSGIIPIDISQAGEGVQGTVGDWLARVFAERITLVDLIFFSRQMHTLLKAGVPILRALAGLQDSARKRALAELLQDLRYSLDSGRELNAALRRHLNIFSPFYVAMVRVGEMTGRLEETFLSLYNHLEFERDMRERVKSALRYPSFVVAAMAAAVVIINLFVIPAFAKVYQGFKAELPFMTKLLIGFSDFMVQSWPVLLAIVVGTATAFRVYISTTNGRYRWDRFKLRVPVAGKIVLKATLARFARSFAMAFKSGVPVVQALTVVAQVVDNDYVAHRIEQMRDGVERGESILRTAGATGAFTPAVLQMIAVGEETGELDDMMMEVAEMYEREVEYELRTLSQQIEPILVIGLGVLVLLLALGVFLPLWELGRAALK